MQKPNKSVAIKVPSVGESVREGVVGRWLKEDGQVVESEDILVELETDKATVEIVAETGGKLSIKKQEGDKVQVGETVGEIDPNAVASTVVKQKTQKRAKPERAPSSADKLSPAVRSMAQKNHIDAAQVKGSGKDGRILKQDLREALAASSEVSTQQKFAQTTTGKANAETTKTVPMSMVRKHIAKRLVAAKNETAMLTTFNEVNMSQVIEYRKRYKEMFTKEYGVSLGFMGFFASACVLALQKFPVLNAFVVDDAIEYHQHVNLGIAVSTERGLLVPILKNVERMTIPEVELQIAGFAQKARDNKITIPDMEGGTFTISNGGVFGSLMSTPILNPPQSGILGMHKIEKRPIVVEDKVEVAPMMYIALSYDHRVADGKEAVGFLRMVKELIETPARLVMRI